MAMFCLILAVLAVVLAGGAQICHCDGQQLGSAFYSYPNGDRLEKNVWNTIERVPEEFDHLFTDTSADGLPVTRLSFPSFQASWPRRAVEPRELMVLELLLNRYRKYMLDEFARFDDACSLLYDGSVHGATAEDALERSNESTEISSGKVVAGRMDDTSGSGTEKISDSDSPRDDVLANAMKITQPPSGNACSRSARQFYNCLVDNVSDQQLIGIVQEYLQTICNRDATLTNDVLHKRDAPRYVSKQKFHSWGGKRSKGPVFYPWGGKRNVVRPHKQPKVVIRNPFHSWGGKRSDLAADDVAV